MMNACSSESDDIDSPNSGSGSGNTDNSSCPVAEAVDLGLPSGTKWASWNIGASSPEEFGGYYAWGETEEKDFYDWSNYSHCDGDFRSCHYIGYDIAGTEYDVAHVKWGGSWRMPTEAQIDELTDNCFLDFIDEVGKKGVLVTGPSGASIFLPAAGVRELNTQNVGTHGCYSSSTLYTKNYIDGSCDLSFELKKKYCNGGAGNRDAGCTVRAVMVDESKNNTGVRLSCTDNKHPHKIDLGLPSGTKWACCNVGSTKPEDIGGHYAWGEIEEKSVYTAVSYGYASGIDEYGNGSYDDYHEDTGVYGVWQYIGDDIAGTQYDVAHVKWGGSWCMPSIDQQSELYSNCSWTWTFLNGEYGQLVTGPNGKQVFLPAAGCRLGYFFDDPGKGGYYWSSTFEPYNENSAYLLHFYTFNDFWIDRYGRRGGYSVRAVCP